MDYDILFINQHSKNGKKDLEDYFTFLFNYNLYNQFEENWVSQMAVLPRELDSNFGKPIMVDGINTSVENLKKGDRLLMLQHTGPWNYTSAFGLDKDFIPTISEIEMIKHAWLGGIEEADRTILNEKFFDPVFDFNFHKPKENLKISTEEELKYCSIQKAAIMIFDYYKQYDTDFLQKVSHNQIQENVNAIDEIYNRLTIEAIADVNHIKDLKNSKNAKVAEQILGILDKYCVTRIDYVKKMQEINIKGAMQGINMIITVDELIQMGLIKDENDSPSLPAFVAALEKKYQDGINEKIAREKEAARLAEEESKKERAAKREEDRKAFDSVNVRAKKLKMRSDIQTIDGINTGIVYDDYESFRVCELDATKKVLINVKREEVDKLDKYLNELEMKASEAKKENPDADNEHRMFWKAEKPAYINDFKYEKFTPLALRGRKQFVCWRTEWKPSGKKLVDERGLPQKDEDGNDKMLPLYDKDGNIIYDAETGLPKLDGKWTKVPYNPNVKLDPEKPWLAKAKADDERTWGTFDQACKAIREYGYDGLGIELGYGLIGGDLDNAFEIKDGKKVLKADKAEILAIANTYSEYSPSKTGVHFLSFGQLPEGNIRKRNDALGLEFYGKGRFFTLTGDVVDGIFKKLALKVDGTKAMATIYDKFMPQPTSKAGVKIEVKWDDTPNELGLSTEEIIKKLIVQGERKSQMKEIFDYKTKQKKPNPTYGINVEKELFEGNWSHLYPDQSTADFALLSKAKYYTTSAKQLDEIMRESGLMRDKWEEQRGYKTYAEITIQRVFEETAGQKMFDPNWAKKETKSTSSPNKPYKKQKIALGE